MSQLVIPQRKPFGDACGMLGRNQGSPCVALVLWGTYSGLAQQKLQVINPWCLFHSWYLEYTLEKRLRGMVELEQRNWDVRSKNEQRLSFLAELVLDWNPGRSLAGSLCRVTQCPGCTRRAGYCLYLQRTCDSRPHQTLGLSFAFVLFGARSKHFMRAHGVWAMKTQGALFCRRASLLGVYVGGSTLTTWKKKLF